jgi:5'-deoxynucleotidase YfbR-like HD superfamily hydrolase
MAADRVGAPPRAWQRMLSGRRLDLLDPSPLDIEISDIAHGLARVARWNGQTRGDHAFSVAQHSLLVEALFGELVPDAPAEARLAALLHDAPEYVIGDMISPFKSVMGGSYKECELRLQRAIHQRFSLPPELGAGLRKEIKRADQIAAYYEATLLAGFSTSEATEFFGRPRGFNADRFDFTARSVTWAQSTFLKRFAAIETKRQAAVTMHSAGA